MSHLEHHLADTRAQVDELHLVVDRGDRVNHLVDQLKTCLPVNFGCERLIIVQLIWVWDSVVVHLDFPFKKVRFELDPIPVE